MLINECTFEYMDIGLKQDVKKGKAIIRCTVDGTIKDYEIEIIKVDYSNSHRNKGMVIEITDEELLDKTGGIVQGMSGSPIVQNGKIIGAVTHVFINNSTKGYGIFIENMLKHIPDFYVAKATQRGKAELLRAELGQAGKELLMWRKPRSEEKRSFYELSLDKQGKSC